MSFNLSESKPYAPVWNKYRPAILKLMVASADEPQQYKLYSHEFKAMNPKEKGFSFTLQAFQGKAVNNIRKSPIAQDLLTILEQSKKASELMNTNTYEFTLDKHFVLRVTKQELIESVSNSYWSRCLCSDQPLNWRKSCDMNLRAADLCHLQT